MIIEVTSSTTQSTPDELTSSTTCSFTQHNSPYNHKLLIIGISSLVGQTAICRIEPNIVDPNFSVQTFEKCPTVVGTSEWAFPKSVSTILDVIVSQGLRPSRESWTSDGSYLIQFLGEQSACVDLYPSGEMVVLIRSEGREDVHDLLLKDTNRMIQLLQDGILNS